MATNNWKQNSFNGRRYNYDTFASLDSIIAISSDQKSDFFFATRFLFVAQFELVQTPFGMQRTFQVTLSTAMNDRISETKKTKKLNGEEEEAVEE